MSLSESFIAELQHESATTRRLLERVPESEFDWKPHEKSMTMRQLATHVAEMTTWLPMTVHQDELDFATMDYKPTIVETTNELVEFFEKNLASGVEALKDATDEQMMQPWKLRNGAEIYFEQPKAQVVRGMVLNHVIHHRAQLSVYLRLKDVPVPAMYGPSADEPAF